MTTVYRIEHKDDGLGMYLSRRPGFYCVSGGAQDNDRHPSPYEDSKLGTEMYAKNYGIDDGQFNFGFGSVGQLRNWIYKDEWLVKLHQHGFILAIIEVPDEDCAVGNTQAMFIRPLIYEKVSIVEYFKLDNQGETE